MAARGPPCHRGNGSSPPRPESSFNTSHLEAEPAPALLALHVTQLPDTRAPGARGFAQRQRQGWRRALPRARTGQQQPQQPMHSNVNPPRTQLVPSPSPPLGTTTLGCSPAQPAAPREGHHCYPKDEGCSQILWVTPVHGDEHSSAQRMHCECCQEPSHSPMQGPAVQ